MTGEGWTRQGLGEDISGVTGGRDPLKQEGPSFDVRTTKMIPYVDMFGAMVVCSLSRECDRPRIVSVKTSGGRHRETHRQEEGPNPQTFLDGRSDRHILGFGGGQGLRSLFFRRVGDDAPIIEPTISCHRNMILGVCHPVSITESMQKRTARALPVVKAMINRACKVTKDTFRGSK